MRKLYLNQKVWSLREKFTIRDEHNHPVYQAVGSVFQVPKHFDILDMQNTVIARVTKKPLSWLPLFSLEIGGQPVATIQKKFTLFKPRYDLSASGVTVTGDFWDMNFTVSRQGHTVGKVAKRWFSLGDQYEITIAHDDDTLLLVGLVIAIDYVKRTEQAAANSGNHAGN